MSGIDTYTKLLLHLDNNVDDSEITPKTVTNNNVTFSDSVKKFGYAARFIPASNAYLSLPDSSDFDFGTSDFTIDFWLKLSVLNTWHCPFIRQNTSDNHYNVIFIPDSNIPFMYFSGVGGGSKVHAICTNPITDTNWHHYAFIRNGILAKIFIDGVSQVIVANGAENFGTQDVSIGSADTNRIGAGADSFFIKTNGYIDEFRVSKGIARWTSNFTPPIVPYSLDSKSRNQAIIIA